MNAAKKAVGAPSAKSARRPGAGPRVDTGSSEARKLAMLVLAVLGGDRTPTEAAQTLGVSVVRFYALEARALAGLVQACEPRSRGPGKSGARQIALLQRKVEQLERECARRQSLLRVSQRAAGVLPSQPTGGKPGKRRSKKPAVRALRVAAELGWPSEPGSDEPSAATMPREAPPRGLGTKSPVRPRESATDLAHTSSATEHSV